MPKATPERPWLAWYSLKRWTVRRAQQLNAFPLCAMCEAKGLVVAAQVADHVVPHKGDPVKFWFGELQSLCIDCHNAEKQQVENKGYTTAIGIDGWPVDPLHPVSKLPSKF